MAWQAVAVAVTYYTEQGSRIQWLRYKGLRVNRKSLPAVACRCQKVWNADGSVVSSTQSCHPSLKPDCCNSLVNKIIRKHNQHLAGHKTFSYIQHIKSGFIGLGETRSLGLFNFHLKISCIYVPINPGMNFTKFSIFSFTWIFDRFLFVFSIFGFSCN